MSWGAEILAVGSDHHFVWGFFIFFNDFICSPIIIEIEIYDKGPLKKVKFNQNWPIYEEIYVYEGRGRGEGPLIINFYLNYCW